MELNINTCALHTQLAKAKADWCVGIVTLIAQAFQISGEGFAPQSALMKDSKIHLHRHAKKPAAL